LVVCILEEQTDRPPDRGERGARDGLAEDEDGGCGRAPASALREDPVEVQQQGRLAGAVGSDEADALALLDLEVEPPQRFRAVGIAEAQISDLERKRHFQPRAAMAA
jgi:hypothetical protein